MNHRERTLASLDRQRVDRLPWFDGLWGETKRRYIDEGHMIEDEDPVVHFDMSVRGGGWLNSKADIEWEDQVVAEDEESITRLDGNGAKLRHWKNHSGTPEHVDFTVTDRAGWEEHVRPHLIDYDERRINFEFYREQKEKAAAEGRAFHWSGVAPFEQMHPVCGHEHMLMGMALDPDWVRDMVEVYADLTIRHLDVLFEREGLPDYMMYYEDMGFKDHPFMSPQMYEELVQPGHARLFAHAHERGLKVMVHSCGFIAPLVPGMIDAGMDCLQAMEVKAGMDLAELAKEHGEKISFCGGLDIRILARNDREGIVEETRRKVGAVLDAGSGYVLHSDHSIPPEVDHDTLKFFFEECSQLFS